MKKWYLAIILTLSIAMVASCGNKGTDNSSSNNQDISLEKIYTQTKDAIAEDLKADGIAEPIVDGKLSSYLEADLTSAENPDRDFYLEKLGIKQEQLNAGYVIAAMMSVNSDEIILLEAKDETEVASLKTALEKELAAQTQTWEQYLPDQFEKVKNNIIQTNGNFLIYITYDYPEKIAEIFNAQTK